MTKIHLSFLRDLMGVLNLPYVTDGYNMADAGAKAGNNSHLSYELASTNRFAIAFLPRQELQALRSSPVAVATGPYVFSKN